jgi:hypothetical protein
MSLHLLGICRRDDIARLPGCWRDGQPAAVQNQPDETIAKLSVNGIRWVAYGRLAASMWPGSSISGPLEHAHLLAAVHKHIDILPVRYGTVLPDEEAVRQFVGNRRDDLLHDLVRVAGTGEIGLRIDLAAQVIPRGSHNENNQRRPTLSPGQYLALRREHYVSADRLDRQTQLVTEEFVQAVHGLYCDWRPLNSTVSGIVRLAFLVQRVFWKAFRQRLEAAIQDRASRRCTLLGPWPPYSFV